MCVCVCVCMYVCMFFRVMRCLQAKVEHWNEQKQVMPKSKDISRSLENKTNLYTLLDFVTSSCTYDHHIHILVLFV